MIPQTTRCGLWTLLCQTAFAGLAASSSGSTIVSFDSSKGPILVRLFDAVTPNTVDNFLSYAEPGRYDGTFIHRSPPDFVVQGGGFALNGSIFDAESILTDNDVPIGDEPGLTNVPGTLAPAKNSFGATSQWYFNIGDNTFLDAQGFSVFGRTVGGSQTVVQAINSLDLVNASVAENAPGEDFDELPVKSLAAVQSKGDINPEDAVMINAVTVMDFPAGDYNFDGVVSLADLAVWEVQQGGTLHVGEYIAGVTPTEMDADGNGDGRVDLADRAIWQQNVPEPAALLVLAAVAPLIGRRRQ
ncbi:MAG: peptidylprolyl isomerase [Planctomycetota bacterium]